MKRGKKPTRIQKKVLSEKKLNPNNWLVTKCNLKEMFILKRNLEILKQNLENLKQKLEVLK